MNKGKRYGKLLLFVLLALLIWRLDGRFGWSGYISGDGLATLREQAKDNLLSAALVYTVLTVVGCVVLALPGVTFAVAAGLLFGPVPGTLLCLLATTVGAVAAFLAGRFFLRDAIRPMVMKNAWLKKVLFDEAGRSDMALLAITRLVPLFPYNLQNFAYGITEIRLLPYTLYTFVFMAPGVALFTVGSAGVTAGEDRRIYFGVAALLLLAVVFLGRWVKSRFLGREEENDHHEQSI